MYKYHFFSPLVLKKKLFSLEMVIYDLRSDYEFVHTQFWEKNASWFKL